MDFMQWLLTAQIPVAGSALLLREVVGNAFGLASALGGMARRVWAWPVGIAGNLILLTVFAGAAVGLAPASGVGSVALYGQAGRQLMFLAVSVYGWVQWRRSRREAGAHDAAGSAAASSSGTAGFTPRWASGRTRVGLVLAMAVGTAALTPLFAALGSYPPVWADAWTFMGSLLATYGMARGWTEFWLIWVAVDLVGVPLLFSAGYVASAVMYAVYGAFTIAGFFVWRSAQRAAAQNARTAMAHSSLADPTSAGTPEAVAA